MSDSPVAIGLRLPRMSWSRAFLLFALCVAIGAGVAGWLLFWGADAAAPGPAGARRSRAAPVEMSPVTRGRIVDRRVFSGTLLPRAQFIVAPKVPGRVDTLAVDIGSPVRPGQIVARLDDDEFQQAVAEAAAELEVQRAQVTFARSNLDVAQSSFERIQDLREREIASGTELDVADADLRAKRAQVEVALARVASAEAVLEAARVRLRYTDVEATWSGDGEARVVAERFVDEGATVAANDPIATVVDIATVRALLGVTERDFARLAVGQSATVRNDAYPDTAFVGRVLRLAPVFDEGSRQVRVEVEIDNPERLLRPGMFVRVEIDLESAADATIVPVAALVRRGDEDGVFVVAESDRTAHFVPVRLGIRSDELVQVFGDGVEGDVVTLGQQLLENGTRVRVPAPIGGKTAGDE